MTQHNGGPKQPSKFPQYIAPIIILLLAIGAAIYGVLWSQSEDTDASNEETTQTEQPDQTDSSAHQDAVEQDFPDAETSHQEALATARGVMETYIHSEQSLELALTDPEHGNAYDQDAADFAMEHIDVDWNEEARQFAVLFTQEYPDTGLEELEELMQHDPQGPQYSAEQTDYALSQLN